MAWQSKAIFIGSHVWFVTLNAAYTSPNAGNVTQNGAWPDQNDPNWINWALGTIESAEIDPKPATGEEILAPTPGAVQAIDNIVPYALPEFAFTTLLTDALAIQLAYNTQQLTNAMSTTFAPNGGGGYGARGILKVQKYDHNNNLIMNWQSWVFLGLKSGLKAAPKTMTKPEYMAKLLYSPNNVGTV